MKAVVTGGAGFIGSHIVDALVAEGAEVLVLDDYSTGRDENLTPAQDASPSLQVVRADICSDDALQAVKSFQPDCVFHLAAQINVRRSVSEPVFDGDKNVLGTINMLEAAKQAGTKKFIFSSTGGAIYGEQDIFPAPETHAIHPECPYGVSKRAAELYLEFYSRAHGMTCVSLRYSNVYGPRQNPKGEAGVVAIFTDHLLAGETLRVNGDGEQTRDFVFVGDVVRANMLASKDITDPGFTMYNVGRGFEASVLDIVRAMRQVWSELGPDGVELRVEHGPELPGEQRRSVIDPQSIQEDLGWNSSMELEEGLRVTIESFQNPPRSLRST